MATKCSLIIFCATFFVLSFAPKSEAQFIPWPGIHYYQKMSEQETENIEEETEEPEEQAQPQQTNKPPQTGPNQKKKKTKADKVARLTVSVICALQDAYYHCERIYGDVEDLLDDEDEDLDLEHDEFDCFPGVTPFLHVLDQADAISSGGYVSNPLINVAQNFIHIDGELRLWSEEFRIPADPLWNLSEEDLNNAIGTPAFNHMLRVCR